MVLYTPSISLDLFLVFPIIMVFFMVYFYCMGGKKNSILLLRTIVVTSICIIILLASLLYNLIPIVCYYEGNYEIVEGYVENFIPRPVNGHAMETFSINGIKFSYSEGVIKPGYRKTYYHGGCITGNGQQLKIGYINYGSDKAIIYIEEIS